MIFTPMSQLMLFYHSLEQVLENVDILLPKVRVIGIAQFTRRACEEIVTDIVLDETPVWSKILLSNKTSFYFKDLYIYSQQLFHCTSINGIPSDQCCH